MMKSPLSHRLLPVLVGVSVLGLSACGPKDSPSASNTVEQVDLLNDAAPGSEMTLQNDAAANALLAREHAAGANMAAHERKEEAFLQGSKGGENAAMATTAVAPGATTISYSCSRNVTLTAAFAPNGAESVAVTLPDGSQVVLPKQVSASGARYAKSGYELWQKGDGATWNDGKRSVSCKPQ